MARQQRAAVGLDETLDYQSLYLNTVQKIDIDAQRIQELEAALQISQENYADALEKNANLADELSRMELQLSRLGAHDEPVVEGDFVWCTLDPAKGETVTKMGTGGSVIVTRTVTLNGQQSVYECGKHIKVPVDHARVLGVLS